MVRFHWTVKHVAVHHCFLSKEKIMSQIASMPSAACLQARTGAFVLPASQALALEPRTQSIIRMTYGCAWVTIDDGVDYFLSTGQQMLAPAGSRMVMESMQRGRQLTFDWQPVMQAQPVRSQLHDPADVLDSEVDVSPTAQALRDLRDAADLAVRGFAGLAAVWVAVVARGLGTGLAALARNAHSSASRAHGRMAS
jgi:Protein of unknown function (DUF2917)